MKRPFLVIKYGALIYVSCLLSFFSCNQDDDANNMVSEDLSATVFGNNNNSILQATISTNTTEAITYNLTESSGVDSNSFIMTTNNGDDRVGFYFYTNFNFNGFTVWERNLLTNETLVYPNGFCNEADTEETFFPEVTANYITTFVVEPSGTSASSLSLRIYNKSTNFCSKTFIGSVSQFQSLKSVIIDDVILTYHFNHLDQAFITKINLATGLLEGQLTLNQRGFATINAGQLYYYTLNDNNSLKVYDIDSFNLLSNTSFNTTIFLTDGLYTTETTNDSFLIDLFYPQPSPFITFPALLNKNTGETTQVVDLNSIRNNLLPLLQENTLSVSISSTYKVDLQKNILVGSYSLVNSSSIENYGVYFANLDSTIIGYTSLAFPVQNIIIN